MVGERLSDGELSMLRLAARYGDGLCFTGPRIGRDVKGIVKLLMATGYLCGSLSDICLTTKGRDYLRTNLTPTP